MKLLSLFLILVVFTACNETAEEDLTQNEPMQDTTTAFTETDDMAANIPDNIKSIFNQQYPNAQDVVWEDDGDEYEVEFVQDGFEFEAEYDLEGTWIETESEIEEIALPQAARDQLKTEYPGFNIDDIEFTERAGGLKYYEVELEGPDEEFDVIIDETGNIIKFDV